MKFRSLDDSTKFPSRTFFCSNWFGIPSEVCLVSSRGRPSRVGDDYQQEAQTATNNNGSSFCSSSDSEVFEKYTQTKNVWLIYLRRPPMISDKPSNFQPCTWDVILKRQSNSNLKRKQLFTINFWAFDNYGVCAKECPGVWVERDLNALRKLIFGSAIKGINVVTACNESKLALVVEQSSALVRRDASCWMEKMCLGWMLRCSTLKFEIFCQRFFEVRLDLNPKRLEGETWGRRFESRLKLFSSFAWSLKKIQLTDKASWKMCASKNRRWIHHLHRKNVFFIAQKMTEKLHAARLSFAAIIDTPKRYTAESKWNATWWTVRCVIPSWSACIRSLNMNGSWRCTKSDGLEVGTTMYATRKEFRPRGVRALSIARNNQVRVLNIISDTS